MTANLPRCSRDYVPALCGDEPSPSAVCSTRSAHVVAAVSGREGKAREEGGDEGGERRLGSAESESSAAKE
eukprot:scaffold2576_cov136-Isochrysis_galbana.AAC.6